MDKLIKSDGWSFAFNKEDEDELLKIITALSKTYLDGTIFIPHITCYHSTKTTKAQYEKLIGQIKQKCPFKIKLNRILFEKSISKTLYIEVEQNQEMIDIVKIFEKTFKQKFDFNPHISLIYKQDLSIIEREKLAKSIKYPKTIEVDALLRYTNDSSASNFANWETERIEL